MARYRVNFIKNLCDDTGHQHKCVEGVVKIRRAKDQDRANSCRSAPVRTDETCSALGYAR